MWPMSRPRSTARWSSTNSRRGRTRGRAPRARCTTRYRPAPAHSRRTGPRPSTAPPPCRVRRRRCPRPSTNTRASAGASSAARCPSGTRPGAACAAKPCPARPVWRATGPEKPAHTPSGALAPPTHHTHTPRPYSPPKRPRASNMSETPSPEDELAGTEQPFVQHLVELRARLLKAIAAVGIALVILFFFPGPGALYDFLAAPLVAHLPKGATLIATSVISPFVVPLKILLMTAFLLALPYVLWQVWAFVAPGLYAHEKRLVLPLGLSSTLLFFIGVGVFCMRRRKGWCCRWCSPARCCFSSAWRFATTGCSANCLLSSRALRPRPLRQRPTSRPT